MDDYGERKHFENAESFVEALDNFSIDFPTKLKDDKWYFRGQNDSNWHIQSSSSRNSNKNLLERIYREERDVLNTNPISSEKLERNIVRIFCEKVDEEGLLIPGYTTAFKNKYLPFSLELPGGYIQPNQNWSDPRYYDVIALAQHYGIPTRFIDFTKDPLYAAYFSTKRSGKTYIDRETDLVIYALMYSPSRKFGLPENNWNFISPVQALNPNLRKQKGVFFFNINDGNSGGFLDNDFSEYIIKIILPHSQIDSLLSILTEKGITYKHLFPEKDERKFRRVVSSIYSRWE
ncbi:FRG domain-containing protein [bacterium]|nr:FRG domain-containing protein [bacterium]